MSVRCFRLRSSKIDVSTFEDRCIDFRRSTMTDRYVDLRGSMIDGIKSHRDLHPAATRRSLAPSRACTFPTVTSHLLPPIQILVVFIFAHTYHPRKMRNFAPRENFPLYIYGNRSVITLSVPWNSRAFCSVP